LKSEHARVAADLSAQKDAEISSKKDLIASHQVAIESLTSTKDAALADAESRANKRETELQAEMKNLTDAVGKAQAQFIVLTPFPRPHGVFSMLDANRIGSPRGSGSQCSEIQVGIGGAFPFETKVSQKCEGVC
jgi:hypothetical protein